MSGSAFSDRLRRRLRLLGATSTRFLALLAVIGVAGVGLGYAVGYPVSKLDVAGDDAVLLDQQLLAGSFQPSEALVSTADLGSNWQPAAEEAVDEIDLLAESYCGSVAELPSTVGEPLVVAFFDPANGALLFSQVTRTSEPAHAQAYITELTSILKFCRGGEYFRENAEGQTEQTEILDNQGSPVTVDEVSRELRPVEGSLTTVIRHFQVGTEVVALQYSGARGPDKGLLEELQLDILARVAPDQFSPTIDVAGVEDLPAEDETPDTADISTTTYAPYRPDTPDPTFETPRTTTTGD